MRAAAAYAVGASGLRAVDAPESADERRALRRRALEWFSGEVAALEEIAQDGAAGAKSAATFARKWLSDSDFVPVRPPSDFAGIPPEEAAEWRAAWVRCSALAPGAESRPETSVSR